MPGSKRKEKKPIRLYEICSWKPWPKSCAETSWCTIILEPGKQANLVIWDGDPLEIMTLAEQVIVKGKIIPMVSRSTRLRDRYLDLDNEREIFYRK